MHHQEQELDRHQLTMTDLESMVAQDSYARLVDCFVDSFPMGQLGFALTAHEATGRPPYHPSVFLENCNSKAFN